MYKKYKDLTLNDLPNVNPQKFYEWKRIQKQSHRISIILLIVFILYSPIYFISTGDIWILGLAIISFAIYLNNRKFQKSIKELGITPDELRQATKVKK